MLTFNAMRPVLLGRLAVYAPDLETARQVYKVIESETQTRGFGTVTLDNGQEIDWVDMGRGACHLVKGISEQHERIKMSA